MVPQRALGVTVRQVARSTRPTPTASSALVLARGSYRRHTSNSPYTHRSGSTRSSSSSSSTPPKTPEAAAYDKQRRREWIVIGVGAAIFSAGSYSWWSSRREDAASVKALLPTAPDQFTIWGYNATGQRVKKAIPMISSASVESRFSENENSTDVAPSSAQPQSSCLVARFDTNSVAANAPIEDRRAEAIVKRDAAAGEGPNGSGINGDLAFFAVMDGHSGYHTSQYLSQKLIAFVAVELEKLFQERGEYAKVAQAKSAMPVKAWRMLFGGSDEPGSRGLDGDPEIVKRAITRAFVGLDKEIVNTPIELLKEWELSHAQASRASSPGASDGQSLSSLAHSVFPAPGSSNSALPVTATQRSALDTVRPALSGSCALLTYIDSARKDVYVACTGDSRAIGGWFNPSDGKWTIEPLSVDQTGRNLSEVRRMQSEHPAAETDTVVRNGRVLGSLEPTRAFGDARYKWTRELTGRIAEAFIPGGKNAVRPPPRALQTPPYVTARPEVEWRRLPVAREGEKQLKFIVMATDGLWDMLSNEEVGALVAGRLAKLDGPIMARELQEKFISQRAASLTSSLGAAVNSAIGGGSSGGKLDQAQQQAAQQAQAQQQQQQSHHPLTEHGETRFTFQDDNFATHLVRNALGGANQQRVTAMLSIPAPDARRYRDDITVNVILLNDVHNTTAPSSAADAASQDGTAKSKL